MPPLSVPGCVCNPRRISFCMRVEKSGKSGFACVRDFLRSGVSEQIVMLLAPDRRNAKGHECARAPQRVRLVRLVRLIRQVAPSGKLRAIMSKLFDTVLFPASGFGELHHQRWRIEEAFKWLRHRRHIEHVSGLSQQALVHDVGASIITDNLRASTALSAHRADDIAAEHIQNDVQVAVRGLDRPLNFLLFKYY